ncbi:MAG: signal peptidase II [Alphaproteobacteria bacterium]|nr:signal peptidase II [Alphaproteobacteria bacterium]
MNKKIFSLGIFVALIVIGLDQLTKLAILNYFKGASEIVPVTSFFNLLLTWNKGVSFGIFNSGAEVTVLVLTIFPILVTMLLMVWLWQTTTKLLALGLGLIMGGALGNIIDRVRFGGVIDFLDFYVLNHHWPAFNVADSAIVLGVVLLLTESWSSKSEVSKK